MSINLQALNSLVSSRDIEYAYSVLKYDYESEMQYSRGLLKNGKRDTFLATMSWLSPPTSTDIRRLFNQINSFYAEKWARSNAECSPRTFLGECNRLILFRQGKPLGARTSDIEFGVRTDLDSLDPRRQFKRLRGIRPSLIEDALSLWSDAVSSGPGDENLALAFVMSLIAIHPFGDGNGRLGRVAFTWLRARWGLAPLWLAEDAEGEFLRTGFGLVSTEHLMTAVLIEICAGHNSVPYGPRGEDEDLRSFVSLKRTLESLRGPQSLAGTDPFRRFQLHLLEDGHLKKASPRFESISTLVR